MEYLSVMHRQQPVANSRQSTENATKIPKHLAFIEPFQGSGLVGYQSVGFTYGYYCSTLRVCLSCPQPKGNSSKSSAK